MKSADIKTGHRLILRSFLYSDPEASKPVRALQLSSHFSWELPQQLLAVLICFYLNLSKNLQTPHIYKGVLFFETESFGRGAGLSLGNIIIHGPQTGNARRRHEFGHCIQSRILGPFYLLLIGIPSLIWATILSTGWKYGYFRNVDYDTFFIESSATFLGEKYAAGLIA